MKTPAEAIDSAFRRFLQERPCGKTFVVNRFCSFIPRLPQSNVLIYAKYNLGRAFVPRQLSIDFRDQVRAVPV